MKKITVQIPDNYEEVLTVSCVGRKENTLNVITAAFDIRNSKDGDVFNVMTRKITDVEEGIENDCQ